MLWQTSLCRVPGTRSGDNDDTGLDGDELEILKDAGIISGSSKIRKRRSPRHPAKHVVFMENKEEGMHGKSDWFGRIPSCAAARQYITNEYTNSASISF